jgi:hypothetical protein
MVAEKFQTNIDKIGPVDNTTSKTLQFLRDFCTLVEENKFIIIDGYGTMKERVFTKRPINNSEEYEVKNGVLGIGKNNIFQIIRQMGINEVSKVKQVFCLFFFRSFNYYILAFWN